MNQAPLTISFQSTGQRGFSAQIRSQPGLIYARKAPGEVEVAFATTECTVQTREGTVHARIGDAILTGKKGEQWRVSRARFSEKYQPVAPTVPGTDGRYAAQAIRVAAVHMSERFQVVLADGLSVLTGAPGDWLVDYGDGSLGIIAPDIFAATYRIGA
jgi:hypothetical protein